MTNPLSEVLASLEDKLGTLDEKKNALKLELDLKRAQVQYLEKLIAELTALGQKPE